MTGRAASKSRGIALLQSRRARLRTLSPRIDLAAHPGDGPARFYLERCRSYLAGAPLPADPGVIHLDRK